MLLQNVENSEIVDHKSLKTSFDPKDYKLFFAKQKPLKKTPSAVIDQAKEIIYKRENKIFDAPVYDKNSDTKQLTGLVNVILSILGVFGAVFYLGELIHIDLGLRVLVALMGGLVVAFAEIWFYSRDLRNFD